MVPIAIGLNINWVAIGDRFNLYHVMMYLGIMGSLLVRARAKNQHKLTVNHGDEVGVNPPIDTSNNISPSTKGSGQVNHPYLK